MENCDHDIVLEITKNAAIKAGNVIIDHLGKATVSEKGKHNLVTEADYAAQDTIIKMITDRYPEHSIIAEEKDLGANVSSPNLWIIDPLDGTNNFAHGIPQYCVSIAYAENGSVVAGAVYDPSRQELFSAVKNGGSFLNGNKITVSKTTSLNDSIVATGFYYDRGAMMRKTLQSIEKLFINDIHGIRRFGAAALDLCWLSCGRYDAYFEYHLSTWDFAAGMLILNEAGGKCSDSRGNRFDLCSSGIIASNGLIHDSFSKIVRWNKRHERNN